MQDENAVAVADPEEQDVTINAQEEDALINDLIAEEERDGVDDDGDDDGDDDEDGDSDNLEDAIESEGI